MVNELLAAGGLQQLQLVNIVGGMQKPLVENDLILPLDTSRIANWSRDDFIQNYLSEGTPGFDFIGV